MNYQKIYEQLIDRAKNRILDGYVENHHIIPTCIRGSDNITNIVKLTPEEHFLSHLLLIKIYPGIRQLIFAANMMCVGGKAIRNNNKRYGWLRRKVSNELRIQNKGKKQSIETIEKRAKKLKGKVRSDESKEKYRLAKLGKKRKPFTQEHLDKMAKAFLGRKHTEESKEKMRLAHLGKKKKPLTEEHRKQISERHTGRKDSPETSLRRSEAQKLAWIKRKAKNE